MAESFPFIDYTDMLEDLNDDLESGFISSDSTLYLVRQKTPVYVGKSSSEHRPVIDYFYDFPELLPEIKTMQISDAKKICFAAIDRLDDDDDSLKASVELLAKDLKEYTAGNSKRNDRLCKVVFEKEKLIPMMVYYEDSDASDQVETIKASELLEELSSCNGK